MNDPTSRPRRGTPRRNRRIERIATPTGLLTTGPMASAVWLLDRGIVSPSPKWSVEVELGADVATRLRIEIFAEEWGYVFEHDARMSWIRVTDLRFAHVSDEHGLLERTTSLRAFGALVRELEARFAVQFDRDGAEIRTTLTDADDAIRAWVVEL
jgi:hypothetical protein